MNYDMTIGEVKLKPIEMPPLDSYSVEDFYIGEHRRDIRGKMRSRITTTKKRWSMTLLATTNTMKLKAYIDGRELSFIDYDGQYYQVKMLSMSESAWPRDYAFSKEYGLSNISFSLEEV